MMRCEQELCANWDGTGCPCDYLDLNDPERPVVCGFCQAPTLACEASTSDGTPCCSNCTHPYVGERR